MPFYVQRDSLEAGFACGYIVRIQESALMLSDTEVGRTKAGNNPYKLSDGGNMFLWVTPAGGKVWRWAYRFDGKAKLMTLGKYPEVSLALARSRHADARRLFASGIDPMVKRK